MFGSFGSQQGTLRRRRAPHVIFPDDIDQHDPNAKVELTWTNSPKLQLQNVLCRLSLCLLWISFVFCITFLVSIITCDVLETDKPDRCGVNYPLVPLPVLQPERTPELKKSLSTIARVMKQVELGQFDYVKHWKHLWSREFPRSIEQEEGMEEAQQEIEEEGTEEEEEEEETVKKVEICAIVYNDKLDERNSGISLPLSALYYEKSIDSMIIIDDTNDYKSNLFWHKTTLFGEYSIDKDYNEHHSGDFENDMVVDKKVISRWSETTKKSEKKNHNIIQTDNVGKWKGFEIGSRLAYKPQKIQEKLEKEQARQGIVYKIY